LRIPSWIFGLFVMISCAAYIVITYEVSEGVLSYVDKRNIVMCISGISSGLFFIINNPNVKLKMPIFQRKWYDNLACIIVISIAIIGFTIKYLF
jgi:hypothetical protein